MVKLYKCPNFKGYSVDAFGNVYSHRKRGARRSFSNFGTRECIDYNYIYRLKPYKDKKGYLKLSIRYKNYYTTKGVHELVLDAFSGKKKLGQVARHLDGNPQNNHPDNLKWGSHAENAMDRVSNGTYANGESHVNAKLTNVESNEIRLLRKKELKLSNLQRSSMLVFQR